MKLPKVAVFALAIAAGALQIIQQYAIPMSGSAHTVVAFGLFVLLSIGVVPLSSEALGKLIPLHVAAVLTVGVAVLQAVQQLTLNISSPLHSIISVALLMLAALGITPGHVSAKPSASQPLRR